MGDVVTDGRPLNCFLSLSAESIVSLLVLLPTPPRYALDRCWRTGEEVDGIRCFVGDEEGCRCGSGCGGCFRRDGDFDWEDNDDDKAADEEEDDLVRRVSFVGDSGWR